MKLLGILCFGECALCIVHDFNSLARLYDYLARDKAGMLAFDASAASAHASFI